MSVFFFTSYIAGIVGLFFFVWRFEINHYVKKFCYVINVLIVVSGVHLDGEHRQEYFDTGLSGVVYSQHLGVCTVSDLYSYTVRTVSDIILLLLRFTFFFDDQDFKFVK